MEPQLSSNLDQQIEQVAGHCHFLQSQAWVRSKTDSPWHANYLNLSLSDGQILPIALYGRRIRGVGEVYYAPKVAGLSVADVNALTSLVKEKLSPYVVFKLELDQPYDETLRQAFRQTGWGIGKAIQYTATVFVDLTPSEEEILAGFKKVSRWEVRTAERRDVKTKKVEPTQANFKTMFDLMRLTAKRGGFDMRGWDYSWKYWKAFIEAGCGSLYFAWHDQDLLSAAFVINIGKRAYYKDGASIREKSDLYASRYLQWKIMLDLKQRNIETYDLGGVTNPNLKSTPAGFTGFKTAFNPEISIYDQAYELPGKLSHPAWQKIERGLLKVHKTLHHELWY